MQAKSNRSFWGLFLLKFTLATLVFYIWFSYNIEKTGYQQIDREVVDYVRTYPVQEMGFDATTDIEQQIQEVIQEVLNPLHEASDVVPQDIYTRRFQALCSANASLCNKIIFAGQVSEYDKFVYLALMVNVVAKTDRFLLAWWYASLINTLQTITINAQWGQRRWGATWNTVVINLDKIGSYTEFFEVFTHEIWHIVDLGVIQWVSRSIDTNFTEFGRSVFASDDLSLEYYKISRRSESIRLALSSADDFCSGYGMTNPFEDFAECFNLYMNHNAYFRYIAQNNTTLSSKYNFIANLMGWSYLFASATDVQRASQRRSNRRPRDTTRMW
jgi:hypothetical protein